MRSSAALLLAFGLALGCTTAAQRYPSAGLSELPPGYGLLALHTSSPVELSELFVSPGIRTRVESGDQLQLYLARAGVYRVLVVKLSLERIRYSWRVTYDEPPGEGHLDLRVEAGVLSYPGQIDVFFERGAGRSLFLDLKVANRSARAWPLIAERFADEIQRFGIRYTGLHEDTFLDWYRELDTLDPAPDPAAENGS